MTHDERGKTNGNRAFWWVLGIGLVVAVFAVIVATASQGAPSARATSSTPFVPPAYNPNRPPSTSTSGVVVRVGGDRGVAFSGAIGSLGGTRSVNGTTPETFTIASGGTVYSAAIQKSGASRQTLSVTISCPSGRQANQHTTAPYGVVSVAC